MNKLKRNIKRILNFGTGNKPFKKKLPPLDSIKTILVISLYFKGDFLFHSAFLEALKFTLPDSKVDLWLKLRLTDMVENDPRVNEILIFDDIKTASYREETKFNLKGKMEFLRKLRRNKYDLIIDLTGKYSTALFTQLSCPKYSIGINYNYFGFCYDNFIYLNTSTEKGHLIDKYLSVLKSGLKLDDRAWSAVKSNIHTKPYIWISDKTKKSVNDEILKLFGDNINPLITIHVTSGWKAKEIDAKIFSVLIEYIMKHKYNFVFIGDDNDLVKINEIKSVLQDSVFDISKFFVKGDFTTSAEIIRRSDLLIGSDSAPLHVAGAVGTPTIGIFGPTNPDFSKPVGEKHRIIYHQLSCSASVERQYCTRNGGFTCPTIDCMKMVNAKEIIEAMEEMLITFSENKK